MAISESRVPNTLRLSGYEIFHSPRGIDPSRVMLAIRKDLTYINHSVPPNRTNEYVAATVRCNKTTITVIASYIEPRAPLDKNLLATLISSTPSPHILTGDFNAHHPLWGSKKANCRGTDIVDIAQQHNLVVLNDGSPTFFRGNSVSSCLDITLSSSSLARTPVWFADIETHGSDHIPTYTLIYGFHSALPRNTVKRTNWKTLSNIMETASQSATTNEEFIAALNHANDMSTKEYTLPYQKVSIDGDYERLRALRRQSERRARKTKSVDDTRQARRLQKKIQRYFGKLSWKRWKSLCESLDPRKRLTKIWSIARGRKTAPQQLYPFRALALSLRQPELAIAEEYCQKLTSNSTGTSYNAQVLVYSKNRTLFDELFSLSELNEALNLSNRPSSPGPDNIRYAALAHLGEQGKSRLLNLYNQSWESGVVPESWKISRIIPVLKPGKSPLDITSFRPIALSSCICKVMERMILGRLEWFLEERNIYPESMSGFRRGRNSVDGVIDLVSSVEQAKKEKRITSAVFFDVKGAFDNVMHEAIHAAVRDIGIKGRLLAWILSYLNGRLIYMSTTEGNTTMHSVTRGVPQGGVLSPVLFNICLIKLAQKIPKSTKTSFYADDICIWTSSISQHFNRIRLQKAIIIISSYLKERGLTVSPEKTAAMAFTRRDTDKYRLYIDGLAIPYVRKHTFLGIVIDRSLSWSPHVKRLKAKLVTIVHILKFISGTRWGSSVPSLKRLYNALFVGLLRYSLPVLYNISRSSMKQLESVQAQALRACLGLPSCTSNTGSVAEARAFSIAILRTQEILCTHLRQSTRHKAHHLATLGSTRKASSFAQVLNILSSELPDGFEPLETFSFPPWLRSDLEIYIDVPGITSRKECALTTLKQHALTIIQERHSKRRHIFTDGSTASDSTGIGISVPSMNFTLEAQLSHATSSTAAELVAIREALRLIIEQVPASWTIFTDSRAALQSMINPNVKSANIQIVRKIQHLHNETIMTGHTVLFQWIPSHCGVAGNESADIAAKNGRKSDSIIRIPYSKADARRLANRIGSAIRSSLWSCPNYHYKRLHEIDPQLQFRVPRGLGRREQSTLHRIRLRVAFTKKYLHMIGRASSPLCQPCSSLEDEHHLLCECRLYEKERATMAQALHLSGQPLSLQRLLGPWQTYGEAEVATNALTKYLKETRLDRTL